MILFLGSASAFAPDTGKSAAFGFQADEKCLEKLFALTGNFQHG
jgi:hypothetical protein